MTIKAWQERLACPWQKAGITNCAIAMGEEIDELRAALKAQLAMNAADADRYRHIRAGYIYIETARDGEEFYMAVGEIGTCYPEQNLNYFDAAIDADILRLESKGEKS